MNRHDPVFPRAREARIRYLDADFQVLEEGDYVRCAITGQPIKLDDLRYWSVDRQEAYLDAAASFQAYRDRFR